MRTTKAREDEAGEDRPQRIDRSPARVRDELCPDCKGSGRCPGCGGEKGKGESCGRCKNTGTCRACRGRGCASRLPGAPR